MINRLTIQNFQAHDKLRVDFDPGITTIIGPSDIGKSAIIRALQWVCTNQPGGDAFVRHGSNGTTVKLHVDGHVVTRRRSPGGEVNEYYLDDNKFVAFGRNVPEAIEALINMGPTGWQRQHDAPYWFSETAGEVSRQLNSIVNLGIIDETLAGVSKAVHRAKSKLETAEEVLTRSKKAYDALAWVADFDAGVRELEELEATFRRTDKKAAKLGDLVSKATRHGETRESASRAVLGAQGALEKGAQALELQKQVAGLTKLIEAVGVWTEAAAVEVPDLGPVEATMKQYRETTRAAKALQNIINDIQEKETILCQAEKEMTTALGLVPKKCPTCGVSL